LEERITMIPSYESAFIFFARFYFYVNRKNGSCTGGFHVERLAGRRRAHPFTRFCLAGNFTMKVDPLPGMDLAVMVPQWRSTIFLHIASPIPTPS